MSNRKNSHWEVACFVPSRESLPETSSSKAKLSRKENFLMRSKIAEDFRANQAEPANGTLRVRSRRSRRPGHATDCVTLGGDLSR
jgi:hypothetical protein